MLLGVYGVCLMRDVRCLLLVVCCVLFGVCDLLVCVVNGYKWSLVAVV